MDISEDRSHDWRALVKEEEDEEKRRKKIPKR